ncbi:hypothetical protein A3C09_01900 [Candidatus Uhrbacteria bacterium RIFCSPHIGHO2_02_FULL_47_44]|uniref:Uncharacterized protein n=1 Tax=Candidatus Uhrbacteria bacterium RIFCSPLOWO2_02_FULL_48_18 TaxID=1802408 RepID=A0A1F7VC33_9BACT|nr:MAG: hypothetical protein A3C09_01900 [Candidatus Uhrbacteria bacterium RIFCSPHIGHO2_02_FULL_47_44]OGL76876.1 MAG: hypothetical protein A3E97_01875 [Candidatus Uhrbacteria bacterium RIFCSPHIGHO2_12_FULL_47_12]OGL82345.1 MAG: hypothetical protein A3B20_01155 [Candidatus Uhrbacteria bacterium RIFCSPLOWO2_01_FULL_47_17]OGL87991.1 MAG: hypothetical protein A3I41_02685 [Candidatus Uhrbacteria bacterium RIFCSPLOWO2_02_FULL_48_18]OGL92527.1 MAG: hypothetical protein A3H12_04485 [Candidatus Uhrbacte
MNKAMGLLIFIAILTTSIPTVVLAAPQAPSPEHLLSDADMTDVDAMSRNEIQMFLSKGSLAKYKTKDIKGVTRSAADIIANAAKEFTLNPRVILVILQKEQSLVESPKATQKQLDWAMGYAICDDCSKSDPRLQKYRGFGKQIYFATKHIREAYLSKLLIQGKTSSGYGPGIESMIDGAALVPQNNATAALYTYTPHKQGNVNFMNIWNRWFTKMFPDGTLIQSRKTGGVWLVQGGKKRPIISEAVLKSRFNANTILPTSISIIEQYPDGAPIDFPNYSLLRSPTGSIYLIVDNVRRGFISMNALRDAGFSIHDVIQVKQKDLTRYTEGPLIFPSTYSSL